MVMTIVRSRRCRGMKSWSHTSEAMTEAHVIARLMFNVIRITAALAWPSLLTSLRPWYPEKTGDIGHGHELGNLFERH